MKNNTKLKTKRKIERWKFFFLCTFWLLQETRVNRVYTETYTYNSCVILRFLLLSISNFLYSTFFLFRLVNQLPRTQGAVSRSCSIFSLVYMLAAILFSYFSNNPPVPLLSRTQWNQGIGGKFVYGNNVNLIKHSWIGVVDRNDILRFCSPTYLLSAIVTWEKKHKRRLKIYNSPKRKQDISNVAEMYLLAYPAIGSSSNNNCVLHLNVYTPKRTNKKFVSKQTTTQKPRHTLFQK